MFARDKDQARVVFNYIAGIIRGVPALEQMVVAWRADEIELSNRIIIAVKTSDYRAIRGVTICCAICDEVAFWYSQGVNPGKAVFQALRPGMVTIPGAKLLIVTTPYAKFGEVFEAHRKYYGQDDADVLMWQAPTTVMNPNITADFIQAEVKRDPEAGGSEWLAQFREDIEAAFTLEMIEVCIVPGRTELLPAQGISYAAFVDPSGGRHDQIALAIGHRSGEKVILDLLRGWSPPIDPSVVVAECAEILKPFGIGTVIGDAYGGEWPREQFREHAISYELSDKNRSELYLNLIPVVCSKRVEFLDNRKATEELRRLERRRGRSGKDSIDHPASGSDDLANALAGVVNVALAVASQGWRVLNSSGYIPGHGGRRHIAGATGESTWAMSWIDTSPWTPKPR